MPATSTGISQISFCLALRAAATVAACVTFTSSANAQNLDPLTEFIVQASYPRTGIAHIFSPPASTQVLLASAKSEALRKHLKLDDDQIKTIDQLAGLDPLLQMEAFKSDKFWQRVGITDEQRWEIELIGLQFDGLYAIAQPAISAKLELSDETKGSIEEIRLKYVQDYLPALIGSEFVGEGTEDPNEEVAKRGFGSTRFNILYGLEVLQVLTPDEKSRLQQIVRESNNRREFASIVVEARYSFLNGFLGAKVVSRP